MKRLAILLILGIFLLQIVLNSGHSIFAQSQTPTPSPTPTLTPDEIKSQEEELRKKEEEIRDLKNKIADLQEKGKTLSSQIAIMDNQISLTEARIFTTRQELSNLILDIDTTTKKIDNLEAALEDLTEVLLKRIVATYQAGTVKPLEILLSSDSSENYFLRLSYLEIAQSHDKRLIYDTQAAKNDYANQKKIYEDKKIQVEKLQVQLESYTQQLESEKLSKQNLLEVTRNDEERYQELLEEAELQISAFKSFATFQGGEQILPPQSSPDGWYFNQRDERWGRNTIGLSSEQMWQVGCLVTAGAMVLKQRGEDVTPADVARESSYYFSNTAYMLIPWLGGKFTSIWSADLAAIDSKLAEGPVIIGVKAGPYGTHFIVFKSGSNGDYIMNDPWFGPDLKFSDHYSTSQIFQYGFYSG